jgi:hypothetical protein
MGHLTINREKSMSMWEVMLYVDGPVTVRRRVLTTQQKSFRVDDPFYSNVEIQKGPLGLKATLTARAPDNEVAYKVAVFFFGGMIDALTLVVNRPMYLSLTDTDRTRIERNDVRRVIEKDEIEPAFAEAYRFRTGSPSFLRSLGWYRKGLTTFDPLDKFLAYWNAIEIVSSKYYRYVPSIDKDRARKGSKSQVWECFKALWGQCDRWPIIAGDTNWIDDSYCIRLNVAHGRSPIDIERVAQVAERLPNIERVAFSFLRGWRDQFLDMDRGAPNESFNDSGGELLTE